MRKLGSNVINSVFGLIVLCFGSTILGFMLGGLKTTNAKANKPSPSIQSDQKSIQISDRADQVLQFGNVRLKNVKVTPNQHFGVSSLGVGVENWLENLQFNLTNKTDKKITYIQFELQFPDTEVNGPLMVYREFGLGVHPQREGGLTGGALGDDEPLLLNPGEIAIATLSNEHLQRIKHFIGLRSFQLSSMNKVVVKILSVTFDNGLMWSSGRFYKPDSNGGYKIVDQ